MLPSDPITPPPVTEYYCTLYNLAGTLTATQTLIYTGKLSIEPVEYTYVAKLLVVTQICVVCMREARNSGLWLQPFKAVLADMCQYNSVGTMEVTTGYREEESSPPACQDVNTDVAG